ncbi:MAG: helix-turn-helix domain-containing protein [Oscillospiraceae bacterium]|nr:helix-turn-helix domain-containing protein [Oscillospiraceae bacterium]
MGLERIKEFKREIKMTNAELSDKSGVPKSTIDKITAGRSYNPNIETVRAIVFAMGKTIDELYAGDQGEISAAAFDGISADKELAAGLMENTKGRDDGSFMAVREEVITLLRSASPEKQALALRVLRAVLL